MNLTALKSWVSGETLTAADLNAEFQNIYTHTINNSDIDSTASYVLGELVIGTGLAAADGGQLHVHTGSAGTVQAASDADEAVFENSTASGITILSGLTSTGKVAFGDSGDNDVGLITYNHATDAMTLTTNGTTALTLSSAQAATFAGDVTVGGALTLTGGITLNGNTTIGDSSADTLTVNSTVTSNLIFTDATYDIGASGATRPRNLYLSGNGVVGGTLGVTGLITATGGVSGALTGNVTGNVTGDVTGDLTGNVTGNVTGNLTGDVTGNISGNVTGGTISGTTGTFTGALTGTTGTFASTGTGDIVVVETSDDTSTAGPILCLLRESTSPADGDYLGQIKFKGRNDAGQQLIYAKITAKTSDVTDTTEDSLIEIAVKADGSNRIVSRQKHDCLQLVNGTGLDVNGPTTLEDALSGTTASFSSTIATTGGYVTVAGNPSAAAISSNGNGQIGGLTGNGLYMYGKGSTYDLALANANTSVALAIPTGGSATPDVYIPNLLGIGTSSPSESLTNRGNVFIETNSTSADSGNGLFWQSTTSGWSTSSAHAAIYGKRTDASNGYLRFDTRQSGTTQEAMRLDASGNMGLGVTPSTWSGRTALEIEGASTGYVTSPNGPIAIGSNIYYNGGDKFVGNGYAPLYALSSGNHIWYTSNNNTSGAGAAVTLTQAMTLTNAGLLGVGTSSPAEKLTIDSGALRLQGSSSLQFITFVNSSTGGRQWTLVNAGAGNPHTNAGTFYIRDSSANAQRLAIDSSGNVGIGTTSPQAMLDTTGVIRSTGATGIPSTGTGAEFFLDSSVAYFQGYNRTGSAFIETRLRGNPIVLEGGSVGIGTSSPTTFAGYTTLHHKNGSGDVVQLAENDNGVIHQIIASGTNTVLIGSRSNHDLKIGTNDTTAITVDTSQRVGIGTSSPTTKFVVSDGGNTGLEVNPSHSNSRVDLFSYDRSSGAYRDLRIDGEELIFRTGSTIAERARILSSGGITFNGDTATANALDDYEEGTFTPTLGGSTTDPTVTYSIQVGTYTKVGNLVTVTVRFATTALTGGAGYIQIKGLPYTQINSSDSRTSTYTSVLNLDVDANCIGVAIEGAANSTFFYMLESKDNTSWSNVTWTQVTSSSFGLWFTAQYYV